MNSLRQTLLFSAAVAVFIIGIYETMVNGMAASYWIFMIALVLLMLYRYGKQKDKAPETPAAPEPPAARPGRHGRRSQNRK